MLDYYNYDKEFEYEYDEDEQTLEISSYQDEIEIIEIFVEIGYQYITILNMNDIRMKILPNEIFYLSNLKSLNITDNYISELSPLIGTLTNLQFFDGERNELKKLPKEIGYLTNLVDLSFHGNELEELPIEFGNLTSLTRLDLISNCIKKLPDEFCQLTNLKDLDLISNKLKVLPDNIGNLTNLKILDISENNLKFLPNSFINLTKLEFLCLHMNKFSNTRLDINNFPNLRNSESVMRVLINPKKTYTRKNTGFGILPDINNVTEYPLEFYLNMIPQPEKEGKINLDERTIFELKRKNARGEKLTEYDFETAIKYGDLNICHEYYRQNKFKVDLSNYANIAFVYNRVNILEWMIKYWVKFSVQDLTKAIEMRRPEVFDLLREKGFKYSASAINAAVKNNDYDSLMMLKKHGLLFGENTTKIALANQRPDIFLWLVHNGCEPCYVGKMNKATKYYKKFHQVFHFSGVSGDYEYNCYLGKCSFCKTNELWNLWELESYEYNSYIQLLPRELLEDLVELLI